LLADVFFCFKKINNEGFELKPLDTVISLVWKFNSGVLLIDDMVREN